MKQKLLHHTLQLGAAFPSLLHHKKRSIITILILSLGISVFVSTFTATHAFRNHLSSSFSHLGIDHVSLSDFKSLDPLQLTYFRRSLSSPCHTAVSLQTSDSYFLSTENHTHFARSKVLGIDSSYLDFHDLPVRFLPPFSPASFAYLPFSCILGASVSEQLHVCTLSHDPTHILIQQIPFKVLGILPPELEVYSHSVFVPLACARTYLFRSSSSFQIDVRPITPLATTLLQSQVLLHMRKARGIRPTQKADFKVEPVQHEALHLLQVLTWVDLVSTLISLITLFASSISLMNMMLVNVRERRLEIGLRKAIGASPLQIRSIFLYESISIALLGSFLGFFSGTFLGYLVTLILHVDFVLPFRALFFSILVGVSVCLISTWIPASKAAKLDPIQALKC